jgi:hypothetical protein
VQRRALLTAARGNNLKGFGVGLHVTGCETNARHDH